MYIFAFNLRLPSKESEQHQLSLALKVCLDMITRGPHHFLILSLPPIEKPLVIMPTIRNETSNDSKYRATFTVWCFKIPQRVPNFTSKLINVGQVYRDSYRKIQSELLTSSTVPEVLSFNRNASRNRRSGKCRPDLSSYQQ